MRQCESLHRSLSVRTGECCIITLANFYKLEDADLLRCRLEAYGIPVYLADDAMVQLDWFYSVAIGGIRVQVADEDYASAKEILAVAPMDLEETAETPDAIEEVAPAKHSLAYRAGRVLFYVLLGLLFFGELVVLAPLILLWLLLFRRKAGLKTN